MVKTKHLSQDYAKKNLFSGAGPKGSKKTKRFLQGGTYDVERILRTENTPGLIKILVDPKEKERLAALLSSDLCV